MTVPLISVIIPCYNAEKTLAQSLESVFDQTYARTEIIAVNDGSTDGTAAVLQRCDTQLHIIKQPNRGASAARNAGFAASHGQLVFFWDADVIAKPHMLSALQQTLAQHPAAAYAYCNFRFGIHTFDLFPFDAERLLKENYISTMSLIRREHFLGFDETLDRHQDWDLWKRMLRQGSVGVWHPERLFYAPMSGGISGTAMQHLIRVVLRKLGLRKT